MDEKDIRTSPKQRIFIILIAVFTVGSFIAGYAAMVIGGSSSGSDVNQIQDSISEEKKAQYEADYEKKVADFEEATKSDYDKFIKYKSEIKAYNENSANESGVDTKDLKEGSGEVVTDENYLAYYVGWCADASVFDSSFDDNNNPTAFSKILDPSLGMIEGWNAGVEGMKMGGIREITIPGELAYGDQREICGGTNKPLKFMVMTVENKDPMKAMASELETSYMRHMYASQYGIDYDQMMSAGE